jgi:hypothetical protein
MLCQQDRAYSRCRIETTPSELTLMVRKSAKAKEAAEHIAAPAKKKEIATKKTVAVKKKP